jgi:hypothetical protein
MTWSRDEEVAMIQRCDDVDMVSFCERDHRGVSDLERKVEMLLGEAGDPLRLRIEHRLDHELFVASSCDRKRPEGLSRSLRVPRGPRPRRRRRTRVFKA